MARDYRVLMRETRTAPVELWAVLEDHKKTQAERCARFLLAELREENRGAQVYLDTRAVLLHHQHVGA